MECTHDHSCEDHDCSSNWSLTSTSISPRSFSIVSIAGVAALTEANPGSVKSVFKAWEERLNSTGEHLENNESDPELLVYIPFTSDVKIKSISVLGGANGTSPSKIKVNDVSLLGLSTRMTMTSLMLKAYNLFRNGIWLVFARSARIPDEVGTYLLNIVLPLFWNIMIHSEQLTCLFVVHEDLIHSALAMYSKFQSVASITLHFPESFGGDTTQIHYIGFKGEATQLKRDVVATIVYEITPNPSDHKTRAETGRGFSHVE
ncbi:hypothetical protein PTKIN_Ptkin03bG0206100 [Pterospermum kingtungense]